MTSRQCYTVLVLCSVADVDAICTTTRFVVEVSLLARLNGLLCHGRLKVKQLNLLSRIKLVSS